MRANKPSTSQPPGAMVTPAENGFRPRIDASAGDDADRVRILIVDDDPALRRTFPHVLARPGRLFDECGSIAEAIGRLERQRYALVLLDYRLPDANGLALLDWLSDHQRDEAVIIISGEDAIDAAIAALRGGPTTTCASPTTSRSCSARSMAPCTRAR